MSSFGRDFESHWDWLPNDTLAARDEAGRARKAHENSPSAVFGEMGLVLAVTLAIVTAINLALALFHIG